MTCLEADGEGRNGRSAQCDSVTAGSAVDGGGRRRAFGHTVDRSAVIAEEAEAIRDAARRVLYGETLSSIVREWNERGLITARGGSWRVNSLSTLLLQPRLVGLGSDGCDPVPAPAPILDLDTHTRLMALHESRNKATRRPTRRYMLTGLLRCWRCGGGLRGMPRPRADLYVCPGPPHGGCSGTAVTADHADGAVRDVVLARLGSPHLHVVEVPAVSAIDDAVARLSRQLASLNEELVKLGDGWAAGSISRSQWRSSRQPIVQRIATLEADVRCFVQLRGVRDLVSAGEALGDRWPHLSPAERRGVLDTVVDHVVVLAAQPPKHQFRPERLRVVWRELPGLSSDVGAAAPRRAP